jgi:uncharacterized repeat protein (TIGR03803 family)
MNFLVSKVFPQTMSRMALHASAFAATTLLCATLAAPLPALAQTTTTLYSFCRQSNCLDGYDPTAGVVMDASGNLYGTTIVGGTAYDGIVFKLNPGGAETVLYTFRGGEDGYYPSGDLLFDGEGNLYGVTQLGGAHDGGTIYKLTPGGEKTVLYNFCSTGGPNCTDGLDPLGGLIADARGNLYGTANGGGAYGGGTAFKLRPNGKLTVLHNFKGGRDGFGPTRRLTMDSAGNLYGTTFVGGSASSCFTYHGCGTLFKLSPSGSETILYAFCTVGGQACEDGANPESDLFLDHKGNLWGTAGEGGAYKSGVVYYVGPNGQETVVHSFNPNGIDGALPAGGLVADNAGNLYGTTTAGGAHVQFGTVYKLDPPGNETILHSFDYTDGTGPQGKLLVDSAGNLYGITSYGGPNSGGTVFKIAP